MKCCAVTFSDNKSYKLGVVSQDDLGKLPTGLSRSVVVHEFISSVISVLAELISTSSISVLAGLIAVI
ncbi:hypothetical protein L6452_14286 [Arctium lappa]|uniref:Uncharacterized protein n=1 Tax=Arctium lappa TaxID=4217 RepID=A0ACB9CKK3_ARCLA|nr:hypothetical protein L6452_14286 [Arctium lappa]